MSFNTLRRPRTTLTHTALLLALAVSAVGCSGDDADPDTEASAGAGESGSAGGASESGAEGDDAATAPSGPQLADCTVSVEVSGDAQASWKGKGEVRVRPEEGSAPSATYRASKGNNTVTLYSPDGDIPYPAVTFSQGQQGFTSLQDDAEDITIEDDTLQADADVQLDGVDKAAVQVQVAFACEKSKKSKKSKG